MELKIDNFGRNEQNYKDKHGSSDTKNRARAELS